MYLSDAESSPPCSRVPNWPLGSKRFMLFEPTMFRGQEFYEDVNKFINELKKQPTIDGVDEILLPGEIELKREKKNMKNGITISSKLEELI